MLSMAWKCINQIHENEHSIEFHISCFHCEQSHTSFYLLTRHLYRLWDWILIHFPHLNTGLFPHFLYWFAFSFLKICSFFFGYFLYLCFKCYLFSWFPLWKPPITCSLSWFHEGVPQSTHQLLLPCPEIFVYWVIQPLQDQGPLHPLMPNKVILWYTCGWSHGSLHMYSLVGPLVSGSSGGSAWLIFLFFLWDYKSLQLLSPLTNSLRTLCSVLCLAVSIHISICQALAEPLRRQLSGSC
jgi:hypothetical protein